MQYLFYLSRTIGIAAIGIIAWGAFLSFFKFFSLEIKRLKGINTCREREALRHRFGSYLLLGLEFLIAADVIVTISTPSLEEIAILASIVVIRTIISYFLDKEMAYSESKECEEEYKK